MEVKKLTLTERLCKLKEGYPAHPEFVPCAIWSFASVPMSAYLDGFDLEMTALAEMLGIPKAEFATYTVKDVACQLVELRDSAEYGDMFPDEVTYFAAPIRCFWHIRRDHAS